MTASQPSLREDETDREFSFSISVPQVNAKPQAPSSKLHRSSKTQFLISRRDPLGLFGAWKLMFLLGLELGTWSFGLTLVTVLIVLLVPYSSFAAFGVISLSGSYTVDTGADLVFRVNQSSGDITSIQYNGVEYQATDKNSQIASGLGTATVTATTYGNTYIKITIVTSPTNSVVNSLTHYLMVTNGLNAIFMATYASAEPTVGELRWITRLQSAKLTNGPVPSDIRNTTNAIESSDVFGRGDGTTRSKYYGDTSTHGKDRAMDLTYCGATGAGIGVWMVFDNPRESASCGPFYRDIQNQCGADQEIYNYMNSGHNQTEAWRTNVLHGPYALVFTSGSPPALPLDYSWIETGGLNLTGWVSSTNRGVVTGVAAGIPAGFQAVVGFANTNAQYWSIVSSNGTYSTPLMKPGIYTAILYKGELEVVTNSLTVTAGQTNTLNLASTEIAPNFVFKIGEWDGTPNGFMNADKIITMHPSDVRMNPWGPFTYTVGDPISTFPMACWQTNNSPVTIQFNLTSLPTNNLTLRAGITCAYAGGRPKPTVNSYTPSSNPSPSSQPSSRSLTVGTYRGNNWLYTFSIPASAFVVGQNTLILNVISGSGSIGPYLNPGCAFDAVELDYANSGPSMPDPPSNLLAKFVTSSKINLAWTSNSTNEVNFLIERSLDNLSYTLIGAVTSGVTNFIDSTSPLRSTLYYRVRSSNAAGKSSYSNIATPVPPTISAASMSGNNFLLNGTGGFPGAAYYILFTTNLTSPRTLWPRIATNTFDPSGNFSFSQTLDADAVQRFFSLQLP
jgi:rhamnogalacturonan endolyase